MMFDGAVLIAPEPIAGVITAPPNKLLVITAIIAPTPTAMTVPAAVDPGLENG